MVELLKECNLGYDSCERQHQLKDRLIKTQAEIIETQAKEIATRRDSGVLSSKATWFALGLLTALGAAYVSRK